ncbi:MAG: hypothetical protein IT239_03230 [Bacteroidia bacterium]|nr:hypothetical protein [Bacteroidia bacterium]
MNPSQSFNNASQALPLFMLNANVDKIIDDNNNHELPIYDEVKQITYYAMGLGNDAPNGYKTIGTRCLRYSTTRKRGVSGTSQDPKNAIDDAKNVPR